MPSVPTFILQDFSLCTGSGGGIDVLASKFMSRFCLHSTLEGCGQACCHLRGFLQSHSLMPRNTPQEKLLATRLKNQQLAEQDDSDDEIVFSDDESDEDPEERLRKLAADNN